MLTPHRRADWGTLTLGKRKSVSTGSYLLCLLLTKI
jgi:hypothetical protein